MSNWLNNKKRIHKVDEIEKPCHKCGYCPYGQLVEAFPCHSELEKYAIKHNRYSKLVESKGWVECKKGHKGAIPDLNWASGKVKEPYSCEVFGHDCPVYYHAEGFAEGKIK